MALSYSIRFAKQGASGRVVMEKEGEAVFNKNGIRIKGKGANDSGEVLSFNDIKDCSLQNQQMLLTNFSKEKFILSRFGTAFSAFLEDFYRHKNEFMIESMQMKSGMLLGDFDAHCEIFSPSGKHLVKGMGLFQIYEGSLIFNPKNSDAFVVYFDFLKRHEIDEDSYFLTIELDNGLKIQLSKLGSSLNDVNDTIQCALEKMFQTVLTRLLQILPGTAIPTLLKLANQLRLSKSLSMTALKKIDASLPATMLDLLSKNNLLLSQKLQYLRGLDQAEFCIGLKSQNPAKEEESFWWACFLPKLNTVVIGLDGEDEFQKQVFFRMSEERTEVTDVSHKLLEINQSAVACKQDFSVFTRPLADLKKHRLFVTITKNSHLRNFKKSVIGYSDSADLEKFKSDCQKFINMAQVAYTPHPKYKRSFKSTVNR